MKPYIFLFLLLTGTGLLSCNKDNGKDADNRMLQSFSTSGSTTSFLYDDQRRVSRIDYDATHSARFEYTPASIVVKFFEGAGIDPSDGYEFTVADGRISSGRRFLTNGLTWDLFYGYDASQRLSEIGIRAANSAGVIYMKYDCYLAYDSKDNMHELRINGVRSAGGLPSDTILIKRTFYENKSYLSLRDMGFDYFGKAAAGVEYESFVNGPLLLPFPFTKRHPGTGVITSLFPNGRPIKEETGEGRAMELDGAFLEFNPVAWSHLYNESDYQYDEKGKLIKSGFYTLVWQ